MRYDIMVRGKLVTKTTREDVEWMFESGEVFSNTPCRPAGELKWCDVNEFFPLLKYPGTKRAEPVSTATPPRSAGTLAGMLWLLLPLTAVVSAAAALFIQSRISPRSASVPPPVHVPSAPRATNATGARISIQSTSYSTPLPQGSGYGRANVESRRVPVSNPPPRSASYTPVSKPVRPPREYTIPLNQHATIHTDFGPLNVRIVDHGPVTFSVSVNYGRMRRVEKQKGFETTGKNITEIYSFGSARVYYVDRISVSSGKCVLKVIPL